MCSPSEQPEEENEMDLTPIYEALMWERIVREESDIFTQEEEE